MVHPRASGFSLLLTKVPRTDPRRMVRSNLRSLPAAAQNGAVTSRPLAAPDTSAGESAVRVPALRPWRRLLWTWVAFWLLLFVLGAQEYLWSGGRELWRPFVDLGTAALVATALAIIQIRRSPRFDHLLAQPARWFLHMWAWLPLQLVAFVGAMYLLRLVLYALAGERFAPGWRFEVLAYEAFKFFLYYALLGGIQFGMRSYRAWATERLRTEQQARLAQQAQLAQLTQQLQPHFLFNALNTVSSLIHTDPDLADALLTRLATLLRAATDASQRPEQPLADELALLHAYADIMTQRFADRVAHPLGQSTSTPSVAACRRSACSRCSRTAFATSSSDAASSRASSCAPRASPGRCASRSRTTASCGRCPTACGVGLGNLERRLQSLYGARATLSLHLRPGGGLIARVELPCAH